MAVPDAPTLISALHNGQGFVRLYWRPVTGATGYKTYIDGVLQETILAAAALSDGLFQGYLTVDLGPHTVGVLAYNGDGDGALTSVLKNILHDTGNASRLPPWPAVL